MNFLGLCTHTQLLRRDFFLLARLKLANERDSIFNIEKLSFAC